MASSMTIQSGGVLEIGRRTSAANVFPDHPTSIVNDGLIRVLDDERIANVSGSGSLVVARETATLGGGNSFTGSVTVNSGATLSGGGALAGAVQVNAGGTLSPGDGLGSLTVGDVAFADNAKLAIQIGGVAANSFDALTAAGAATLAGLLDVTLVDDFMPAAGDVFEILTAADVDGEFDDLDLAPLTPILDWLVSYEDQSVRLEVVSTLSDGDFNEDGSVDGDDLAAWQAGFGRTGDAAHGDGDADGDLDVDGADFLRWQRQLEGAAPPDATTVPEPASAALMFSVLAVAAYANRRVRK
jgi:hypothetical protein